VFPLALVDGVIQIAAPVIVFGRSGLSQGVIRHIPIWS